MKSRISGWLMVAFFLALAGLTGCPSPSPPPQYTLAVFASLYDFAGNPVSTDVEVTDNPAVIETEGKILDLLVQEKKDGKVVDCNPLLTVEYSTGSGTPVVVVVNDGEVKTSSETTYENTADGFVFHVSFPFGFQTATMKLEVALANGKFEVRNIVLKRRTPSSNDVDGDGLPNTWEIQYGLDPNSAVGVNGAYGDFDGDGANNITENSKNTNPTVADSDDDGLLDGWEIRYGLNPLNSGDATQDADKDGLSNLEEHLHKTDPLKIDTDGDGFSDFFELNHGSSPTDSFSVPAEVEQTTAYLTYDGTPGGSFHFSFDLSGKKPEEILLGWSTGWPWSNVKIFEAAYYPNALGNESEGIFKAWTVNFLGSTPKIEIDLSPQGVNSAGSPVSLALNRNSKFYLDLLSYTGQGTQGYGFNHNFLKLMVNGQEARVENGLFLIDFASVSYPLKARIYVRGYPDESQVTVSSGTTVEIVCEAWGGIPPYSFAWKRVGQPVGSNSTLSFKASSSNTGAYICSVTDSAGQTKSLTVE